MQKDSEKSSTRVSDIELNSLDAEKENEESQNNFLELLPREISLQIFSQLDVQSLCRASMACRSWNRILTESDSLWEPHCLAVRTVCKREVDDDRKSGYSWMDTLRRNYQKSKMKLDWLSGRYSNLSSPLSLPEKMYPMDADTWGEILEEELKRDAKRSQTDLKTWRG